MCIVVLPLANMLFLLLQQSPFFAPATSIVKVMSMTIGDFSFDTIFRKSPSGDSENTEEIMFPAIAYLLWIIFLVIMPILFINLLVRSYLQWERWPTFIMAMNGNMSFQLNMYSKNIYLLPWLGKSNIFVQMSNASLKCEQAIHYYCIGWDF